MTPQDLWANYVAQNPSAADISWEAWAFGDDPDGLLDLVLNGKKTATSSAFPLYALEKEPLPQAGETSVIVDSHGEARCIVYTTQVAVIPYCEVSAEHAMREGEGDGSLEWWRMVHERFFTTSLEEVGLRFTPEMPVVCETFKVVYP